jgi:ubiquinone/menaquinone biosynthesis C-methylase UbiE
MAMEFYEKERHTPDEAKFEAQKIAFAPFVFQAALALRDLGVLAAVEKYGDSGVGIEDLTEQLHLPHYGMQVLLEAGLGINLLLYKEKKYSLTNTGYFILHDTMTQVNMNFVQDVNYQGVFHLKEAIKTGQPEGLKVFGRWPTIYQGLYSLPAKVQNSWFSFDQFYSDPAFKSALPIVFKEKPSKLIDVGGNTGKWALECLKYDKSVHVTIADLPGQLRMAERNLEKAGAPERVSYCTIDVLNPAEKFPDGYDAIWMSQFLDCFSHEEIVSILRRVAEGMGSADKLYILECFQDRQQYEAARFCLQQVSLYFACMANGNSQMFHSDDMKVCLDAAGLEVIEDTDKCGISHTLFKCIRKK